MGNIDFMNLIRNGIFTAYKNYELKLVESREEVPVPIEEKSYQIWYENNANCPFGDFIKSSHNNGFYKIVTIDQLKDVFAVRTLGKYNNKVVEVFPSREKDHLQISTRDKSTATDLHFTKVGEDWYMKEVDSSALELVWEKILRVKTPKDKQEQIFRLKELMKRPALDVHVKMNPLLSLFRYVLGSKRSN